MKVVFLGTNGWYTTPTGNTPCILVNSKEYYVIFDAGNGIYKIDEHIDTDKPIYLFLSHFHHDHISGLHILSKFTFKQGINIFSRKGGKNILNSFINHPFTPPIKDLPLKVSLFELPDESDKIPFKIEYFEMKHGDPVFGYRLYLDGKIISYSGDTAINENSLPLAKDADLLIHESSYLPETVNETNWGHTYPNQAATLAKKANAKKLALVHFDANIYRTFKQRQKAAKVAKKIFKNSFAAKDDIILEL